MTIAEFTDTLLPLLIDGYVKEELPLHALVDIDTWKNVFPENPTFGTNQFHWYQISFTCNKLKDGTVLLTYKLPEPLEYKQPKFAGIRLNLNDRSNKRVVFYVLRKPAKVDEHWDLYYMPFPLGNGKMKFKFDSKIDDADTVRNFVYSVQKTSFLEKANKRTKWGAIKDIFDGVIDLQEDGGDSNK